MASTPVYAKFIYNGRINTVALIDGLSVEELTGLLKTVFTISGSIVGIMAEKGLVIPISLVCRSPQVIPNNVCKILVAGNAATAVEDSKPVANTSNFARSVSSTAVNTGTSVDSGMVSVGAESSQAQSEDDASVEEVIQEILRFIEGLVEQKFLNKSQYQLLYSLLFQNSTLLFAAYSVAVSANDSEYFAEICKDLANSLMTEQGRSACEAQDEVLQVCDQLYINERITESQLLYLRHLVLIREEVVANVYDEFQEHQSVPLLAKALFEIANSHPFQSNNEDVEEVDEDRGSEGLEEESEAATETSAARQKALVAITRGLTGVVSLMSRAGLISKTEMNVLFEMIEQENDYVIAAYELYEKDRNLDELQDTLLRCVRLEIRKRVTEIQEEELESLQKERELQRAHAEAEADEEEDEDDDEQNYRIPNEEEDDDDDDEEDNEEDDDDDDEEDDFSLQDISLESILSSLDMENIWQDTVPEPFVQAVFIAVIRRQLEFEQAKALCDLFHANYDLVRAAWEVYTVQQDASDFIDTLRRIVKDLDLDEIKDELNARNAQQQKSNNKSAGSPSKSTSSTASNTSASTARAAAAYAANATARGQEERPGSAASSQQQVPSEVQEARAEAMKAVANAKRELLKHSLEMMVKQGITSADRASGLYSRYLEGDVLIEAAIESYASDRDVAEFLDTLQILCNHSKEDIDALMHAAAAAEEQEQQEQEHQQKQSSSPSKNELALLQITDIVKEMLKNDMIGPAVAEMFQRLIKASDARLIAAYEKYTQNKNGAELVDTLLRIVVASVEGTSAPPTSSAASASKTSPAKPQQSSPAKSSPSPAASPSSSSAGANESILDANDQKKVVEILFKARGITAEQSQSLNKLIDQGNPTVSRIFAVYESDKNVYKLIDALKTVNASQPQSAPQQFNHDAEDEEEEEEESDEEDDEDDMDEDDVNAVETRFMQIVQNMSLSDLETAALRLAIAENDPAIRNAIERFRDDMDQDNLMNSMRAAARAVIERTLSSRVLAEDDDSNDGNVHRGGSDEEEESEEEDENEEDDNEEEDDGNESDSEDEGEEEDEDEGENNDDDDNFNGKSLITPQRARDTVFPILVEELVKESILTKSAGKILLDQFSNHNNVVNAALDVYDADNDMAKLVETLQTFVDDFAGDGNQ